MSCVCKNISGFSKFGIASMVAAAFFVASLPLVYRITTIFFGKSKPQLFDVQIGKPTLMGILYQSALLLLVVFLLQQPWKKNQWACVTADDKTVPCGQVHL